MLPWGTASFILIVRVVLWPVVSIAVIYGLAIRTNVLGKDPMLWFAMMLMPTGPPAMKLITLIHVANGEPEDEVHMTKLLTVSFSPAFFDFDVESGTDGAGSSRILSRRFSS